MAVKGKDESVLIKEPCKKIGTEFAWLVALSPDGNVRVAFNIFLVDSLFNTF